jgi:hypothetical protein
VPILVKVALRDDMRRCPARASIMPLAIANEPAVVALVLIDAEPVSG